MLRSSPAEHGATALNRLPAIGDPSATHQLSSSVGVLRQHLGASLLAIYLHGSAASSGLRPHSDIDLMAVVDRPIGMAVRSELVSGLLAISPRHPAPVSGPRCIDVIIFSTAELAALGRPAQAEFVYGEWLRRDFEAGDMPMQQRDPEHTVILAQARDHACVLFGLPAAELFPRIEMSDVRHAMRDMLPGLIDGFDGDERNVLLTLARIWHTAASGAFVAKEVAAEWASRLMAGDEADVLDRARRSHLGTLDVDWADQRSTTWRAAQTLLQSARMALS